MSSKDKCHELNRKFFRGYVYVLSFCEDMSSKGEFHNLDRKFCRGYVMSSPCVKIISTENSSEVTLCPLLLWRHVNAMSSTKILQRLRYVLSFCEDMPSKNKFHNLNRKFFRGYVMSSPFVKTCSSKGKFHNLNQKFFRGYVMSSLLWRHVFKGSIPWAQPKIPQRLRYVLSFCEDMSSKGQFHELNQKFFRGYVMSSPLWRHVFKGWAHSIISTENSSEVTLCSLLLWRHVLKG